jgi:hypothetical protein
MRKVGSTASGSVIVEMSPVQYEALQKAMLADPVADKGETKLSPVGAGTVGVRHKLDHIRTCVLKLKPSSMQELIRSIKTGGVFTGEFAETEIRHLMSILEREGLFSIGDQGRLTYRQSHPVSLDAT